tara:strand:- start:1118 stop:1633 length:516 start_codon:yes stop_codon:yes gene_type:complete
MKILRVVFYILIFVLPISSCGYHLAGYGSALPPHLRTIAIPVFKNSSSEPNIHRDATDEIRRAFITDGRLTVVGTRKADMILRGTLTNYNLRAVSFGGTDAAEEYVVRLGVSIEVYDQVLKKTFFKQDFTTQWNYRATAGVIDSETARFNALKETYGDLADRLVSTVIEQF